MNNQSNYDIRLVRIDDITIVNAQINNESKLTILPKEKYLFGITYKFEIATNFEGKRVRIIQSCDIETLSKETNSSIGVTGKFDIAFFSFWITLKKYLLKNLK